MTNNNTPPSRQNPGDDDATPQRMARPQRMGQPAAPATPTTPTTPARPQRMGAPAAAQPQRMGAPAAEEPRRMGAPVAPTAPAAEEPQPAPETAGAKPVTETQDSITVSQLKRWAWLRTGLIGIGILVLAVAVVLAARWLRTLEPVQDFLTTYPGFVPLPDTAPHGFPAWLGWQHFLNMFFLVLLVVTGMRMRRLTKPEGYWKARPGGFFAMGHRNPAKIPLGQWTHQTLDVLWIVNGVVFIVLLGVTGHWIRIVPTSWETVPNAVSAGLQYLSLNWPTENSWEHFNSLQMLTYFVTIFIAAPLAALSGVRVSSWWPTRAKKLNRLYPISFARALHFPVAIYFVIFTVVHVFLVFFTGALRNLNHMFTSRDTVDAWGLVIFLGSLVVVLIGVVLSRTMFTAPLAARTGMVTRR